MSYFNLRSLTVPSFIPNKLPLFCIYFVPLVSEGYSVLDLPFLKFISHLNYILVFQRTLFNMWGCKQGTPKLQLLPSENKIIKKQNIRDETVGGSMMARAQS